MIDSSAQKSRMIVREAGTASAHNYIRPNNTNRCAYQRFIQLRQSGSTKDAGTLAIWVALASHHHQSKTGYCD
jgi:hypothetical protein